MDCCWTSSASLGGQVAASLMILSASRRSAKRSGETQQGHFLSGLQGAKRGFEDPGEPEEHDC